MAANDTEDLISWEEIAEDLGGNPAGQYARNASISTLAEIITATWRDQFPQNLPVSVLAEKLKMQTPETVKPEEAQARLDEVLRTLPPAPATMAALNRY